MKNISRRVFIKGLAVAGVAAAASTVLAGCNTDMIPGVDDGKEDPETPAAPTSFTFTDPLDSTKTLTITSKSFALGEVVLADEGTAEIDFQVANKLGKGVHFVNVDPTGTASGTALNPAVGTVGDYFVVVSAYPDGNSHNKNVTVAATGLIDTSAAAFNDGVTDTKTLTLKGMKEAKESVTVKVSVKKILKIAATSQVAFDTVETKEFTYNL